jgi:hypothetical protein
MASYRVIGSVTIDLRFIANKLESNVLILPLDNKDDGSSIEITIQGEILGENEENDDNISINSDSSSGTLSSVLGLNLSNSHIGYEYRKGSPDGKDLKYVEGDYDDNNSYSLDNSQGKVSVGNSSVSSSLDQFEIAGQASKSDYISSLELKLFRQQTQYDEDMKKMKEQLESIKVSSNRQIESLNREILHLKDKR